LATGNTKQAEKEYLARSGSSTWERWKPFSPPGTDTLRESANLLHDFSVAMLTMQPAPDDRILDLGAGAGWCSDLLGRLNRFSVAVDIAVDMLGAGRARAHPVTRGVAADMESLPFRSGVFDKALCLNAIHHVPNIPAALAEIARVLTPDGAAFFSEPGEGHAEAPTSTTATQAFGVLEQEILLGPFMRQCVAAGFTDVRVEPLSHVIPAFQLDAAQWDAWTALATSQRPRRALAKLAFAAAELLGLGKRGPLFEEALAISMVRTLRVISTHHPIVIARKAAAATGSGPRWLASIEADVPASVPRGLPVAVRVIATNRGTSPWRPDSPSNVGHVTIGVQLLDGQGRLTNKDFHRTPLPHVVASGDTVEVSFACPPPAASGSYFMKCDLVAEGVTWFEEAGSPAVSRPITIT